jgi:hypothetical protein
VTVEVVIKKKENVEKVAFIFAESFKKINIAAPN